ncbi:MAG: hypothetical protein CBC48_14410 [bacterium TMED88]|nr:MAG: hypothetical protein CBC48_14410 [bacterium TMED88]
MQLSGFRHVFPSLLLLFPSQPAQRSGNRAPGCSEGEMYGSPPQGAFGATAALTHDPTRSVARVGAPSLTAPFRESGSDETARRGPIGTTPKL